jgi:C4-dicarboxylate-specific signal transduction histidine kinase
MGLLLFFLIISDIFVVYNQRKEMSKHAEGHFWNEIEVVDTAIREPLLRRQYDELEQFLYRWGQENDEILEITAVMPDGSPLVKYQFPRQSTHPVSYEKQVEFAGKVLMKLIIVRDSSAEETIIESLQAQLVSGSVFMTILLGLILWLSMQRIAVKPLEREIATRKQAEEGLRNIMDQLEVMVRERTSELSDSNKNLLLEIDERKKAESEREKLIADLRDAISKIRQLSGLLPICSSCKKIRDDKGYWNQIEEYIRDHSEAEFSHGICPD